jgi:two-component system OmpR family sensor kinase
VVAVFLLVAIALGLAVALIVWLSERANRRGRHEGEADTRRLVAEERRRFFRRLDHELKNPLTAIRAGLANFANAPSPASRQAAIASVEAQTIRLSRLTADLRKIAELESRPLERSAVDLSQLLTEVVALAQERPEAAERRITLTIPQAPWPLPTILGDWDLIFLAVYNLVDNALKFTRPGDTIEVRGREDGARVVVEVADTGPGIAENDQGHVWDELYRGVGTQGAAGSGLGLALVKAIAERHGGRGTLSSRPGRGTVIALHLPANN